MNGSFLNFHFSLGAVFEYLSLYGYYFVLIGTIFEGELILLSAGFFAYLGAMNIWLVILFGVIGAVLGDNLWYWIGTKGGTSFIKKYGKFFFLDEGRVERARIYFDNHGAKTIFVSRFIFGTRISTALLAGALGMSEKKFVASNVFGAFIWAILTTFLGYLFGNSFDLINKYLHKSEVALLILGAAAIIILLMRFLLRNKNI